MKYFKYIAAIIIVIVIISVGASFFIGSETDNYYIKVNNRGFSVADVNQKLKSVPYSSENIENVIKTIIDNEILVQEAQRERIDQEEDFKISIQNFLEQSLVRILIERKFRSIKADVSEKEVDEYIKRYGNLYKISLSVYNNKKDADAMKEPKVKEAEERYEDLPFAVREEINKVTEGKLSDAFFFQDDKYARLSYKLVEKSSQPLKFHNTDGMKSVVMRDKKNLMMEKWMSELRAKAKIQLPNDFKELKK